VVLYPLPAAGTAALVSQGLLLSFPSLDGSVQGGSGDLERPADIHNRVAGVMELLGKTAPLIRECLGSTAFSPLALATRRRALSPSIWGGLQPAPS
jgi:hypothetical protein